MFANLKSEVDNSVGTTLADVLKRNSLYGNKIEYNLVK